MKKKPQPTKKKQKKNQKEKKKQGRKPLNKCGGTRFDDRFDWIKPMYLGNCRRKLIRILFEQIGKTECG